MSELRKDSANQGHLLLSGDLNFATVPEVLEQGNALLAEGAGTISIDLREVTRADSAGLALLVEWMRTAHRHHKNIVFRNIPSQMLAMAKVSRLDHILPLA